MHASRGFFPGQRDDEEVLLVVRHHWIREVENYFWTAGFGGVAAAAVFFGQSMVGPVRELGGAGLSVLLCFVWLRFFLGKIKNDFSLLVLTNQRIMHISHGSFIDIRLQEANLDRVQDVAGRVHGMLMTLWNIGDLRLDLQGQGNTETLVLQQIAAPHETARHILDLYRQHARRISSEPRGTATQHAPAVLATRSGDILPPEEIARLRTTRQRRATDR